MEIPKVQENKYESMMNALIICEQYYIIQRGWHIKVTTKFNYNPLMESI